MTLLIIGVHTVQAIHRRLPDEPDGMSGLEAAHRINGLPCTLKQRIWQLEHAEEWGEVVYAYEQVSTATTKHLKALA
jgi:hypothetical protein